MLLGRDGRTASQLGPLIAEDDATALALLRAALSRIGGTGLHRPRRREERTFARWLEASGFAQQRPFTRMLLGRERELRRRGRTFAVIGPEFG